MAYNRQWLRDQVASYLHDAEATPLIDTWIDIGAKRVSQVLQCWEMETEITIGLAEVIGSGTLDGGTASGGGTIIDGGDAYNTENLFDPYLPLDQSIREVLGVQWRNANGEWANLVALARHESLRYRRSGVPSRYLIENRRVYPLPFQDGDYKVQVLSEVFIPLTADDVVDALVSYPFVFLSAALTEAYDWKQDDKMNARYESKWFTEAQTIANNYRQEKSGESLAQRAV